MIGPGIHSDKLQVKLREEGGIRALLGMVRSRHPDVLAQVARGIANFAKCESRGAAQGLIFRLLLFDVLVLIDLLSFVFLRQSRLTLSQTRRLQIGEVFTHR